MRKHLEQQVSPSPGGADILGGKTDRIQKRVHYRLCCEVIRVEEKNKAGQGLRSAGAARRGRCDVEQAIRASVCLETFEQRPEGGDGSQADIQEEGWASAADEAPVVTSAAATTDGVFWYLVS